MIEKVKLRFGVTASVFLGSVLLVHNVSASMTEMDMQLVTQNAGVDYAYVTPEVVTCVKKAVQDDCSDCPGVCDVYRQLCRGYTVVPYNLAVAAADEMLGTCCDEKIIACVVKYRDALGKKRVSCLQLPEQKRLFDCSSCVPAPDCSGLIEPIFDGVVCATASAGPPIPPTPPSNEPLTPGTPECNVTPPTGALQICSIDVGTITAEDIATFQLCAEEDIDVLGDVIVGGSGSFGGNVVALGTGSFGAGVISGGDADIFGSVYTNGDLNVVGTGFIGGNLYVGGDISVSGALAFNAVCADRIAAETGCINNARMCQLVLENLFIKGFVKADKGAEAFCDLIPSDRQGYGEIVFTSSDIVNYGCLDNRVTGCVITLTPAQHAVRYNFDCGGICAGDVHDLVFGVKLFNRDENTPPGLTLPHVDFAVPCDIDLDCNVLEIDVHLIIAYSSVEHDINFILASNFVSGECDAAEQLPITIYVQDELCGLPQVLDEPPYHLRKTLRIPLDEFENHVGDTLEPKDWIRLSFAVNPQAGDNGLLDDDCVLINSVVVRYPRVDVGDALLQCIPRPVGPA